MTNQKKVGSIGEVVAERYLIKKGYHILQKNYRLHRFEIDIIAQLKGELIFFEIKTSSDKSSESSVFYLKDRQINKIKKAILIYAELNKIDLEKIRLDFIAVSMSIKARRASLRHFINILG